MNYTPEIITVVFETKVPEIQSMKEGISAGLREAFQDDINITEVDSIAITKSGEKDQSNKSTITVTDTKTGWCVDIDGEVIKCKKKGRFIEVPRQFGHLEDLCLQLVAKHCGEI